MTLRVRLATLDAMGLRFSTGIGPFRVSIPLTGGRRRRPPRTPEPIPQPGGLSNLALFGIAIVTGAIGTLVLVGGVLLLIMVL
jgi:hypothetical protein